MKGLNVVRGGGHGVLLLGFGFCRFVSRHWKPNAERHLAKAGVSKVQAEGYRPPLEREPTGGTERAKRSGVILRSRIMRRRLAARVGQSPLGKT